MSESGRSDQSNKKGSPLGEPRHSCREPGNYSVDEEDDEEPSLRFSVGRSSSFWVPVPVPLLGLSAVLRRRVGRSPLLLSFWTLCLFSSDARRDFTWSNSEVFSTYSSRGGRTVAISCWA